MLSIPDASASPWRFADWLELSAIASPRRRATFAELFSGLDIAQDSEPEDNADEDRARDRRREEVQQELAMRLECIAEEYPFRVNESGTYLEFIPPTRRAGAIYLFCLFLSHVTDRSIVPERLAPEVDNHVRDLFQVCCTIAAAGHVEGHAACFGWPRPDGSQFLDALKALYTRIGVGTPHDAAPDGSPVYIKDGGIDVIAWKPAVDGLGITHYFVGQVGSGNDWRKKSVRNDEEVFHDFWFKHKVKGPRPFGTFIPFCIEPDHPVVGDSPVSRLKAYVDVLRYNFGTLFYRYRIPELIAKGVRQIEDGNWVDRAAEVDGVVEWVSDYCARLNTESAP